MFSLMSNPPPRPGRCRLHMAASQALPPSAGHPPEEASSPAVQPVRKDISSVQQRTPESIERSY